LDKELFHTKLQAERKVFFLSLRENPRGRVLRVTEDAAGRRDTIMIPADGLETIQEALATAIQIHKSNPQQQGVQP
jgi:hypothetical protein